MDTSIWKYTRSASFPAAVNNNVITTVDDDEGCSNQNLLSTSPNGECRSDRTYSESATCNTTINAQKDKSVETGGSKKRHQSLNMHYNNRGGATFPATSDCRTGNTGLKMAPPIISVSQFGSLRRFSSIPSVGRSRTGSKSHVEDSESTLPLSESLTMSDSSPKGDLKNMELSSTKLTKRESYKAQRKNYRREKKRVAKELMSTLKDPSIIVMADWLKVRGTLKGWTKLWCVLKPGLLLLYKTEKTHKSSHWIGTVLLNSCEVIERPSKKDGFCFKLFHPLEQSIWASRGNHKLTVGPIVQPLPMSYLIFRAPSESAGKCWMDALELALRCTSLLMRTMSGGKQTFQIDSPNSPEELLDPELVNEVPLLNSPNIIGTPRRKLWNESDIEKHFGDHDLDDEGAHTDDGRDDIPSSHRSTDSEFSEPGEEEEEDENEIPVETPYIENGAEEFGIEGAEGQTEDMAEENKSLIWSLLKQVRPGMDLSRVVLPTFILEARSFLDKLSDYYYHANILSQAVLEDDAFTRMQLVVKWYLSGFYKKPRGLKKPYNPILGETFRCYWRHSDNGSRTFYIAEQVSHHPPISAFYVTNRQDGFCIGGSILAKSKFYGNSLSALLEGTAHLTLLTRGENYDITMPYAHCKGILMGTLTMELGGKVCIACEKTGYRTELEFKLKSFFSKPFLGGPELGNMVTGKIKLGKEVLATIEGHWDGEIFFKDKRSGEEYLFWKPTPEVRTNRLKRCTVPIEVQGEFESERLWQNVSVAIAHGDQVAATDEKTLLEDAQRKAAKDRLALLDKWTSKHFAQDILTGEWVYKYSDSRPWDPRNDVIQYEQDYLIKTKTHHRTPVVRTSSIVSMDEERVNVVKKKAAAASKQLHGKNGGGAASSKIAPSKHSLSSVDSRVERALVAAVRQRGRSHTRSLTSHAGSEESSSPDGNIRASSTESEGPLGVHPSPPGVVVSKPTNSVKKQEAVLEKALLPQQQLLREMQTSLLTLQRHLESVMAQQRRNGDILAQRSDLTLIISVLILQVILYAISHWWFS